MTTRAVVMGNMAMPEAARPLIAELDKYSMRKEGSTGAERSAEH